jgi:hypothetical protein
MKASGLRVIGLAALLTATNALLAWNMSATDVLGQSTQQWKNCGKADGTDNMTCPTCSGTCKIGTQTYKICQDAGTGCKMPTRTNASCNGQLYDGGAGGKGGCTGTVQGSCQYNILKCPP